ncbi:MAG TPA: hypothetical protein VHR45_15580 [Thermoanaerobaculia bacterium]|nr:hypothetical protein [Thermoanaerobaculia bacterium]
MRSLIVVILLPAVMAQGCASAATPYPYTPPAKAAREPAALTPAKLEEINEDLAGQPATIELISGEIVQKAQAVRLGTEVTSWHDSTGRERTVPTAEVRRVLREQRLLIGRGLGYGAAAAVLPGYLVFKNSSDCNHPCGDNAFGNGYGAFGAWMLVVVAGGLIGMLVAAGNRHQVVAYAAPLAPRSAGAGAPGELHCHLVPPAAGDRLACIPAAR